MLETVLMVYLDKVPFLLGNKKIGINWLRVTISWKFFDQNEELSRQRLSRISSVDPSLSDHGGIKLKVKITKN